MVRARNNAVVPANLGLFLGRTPLLVPPRGLQDGLNFRIREGRISTANMGWSRFPQLEVFRQWVLHGGVTLIDQFHLRNGGSIQIFGTTTDLYAFNPGPQTVSLLTPRHEVGQVTHNDNNPVVTGIGTSWLTNLKPGDRIAIGATGIRLDNWPNLVARSEEFDNTAVWNHAQVTVSANATAAPDGTTTADKIEETAATNVHQVNTTTDVVAGQTYRFSVWAKAAERNFVLLDWPDGQFGAGAGAIVDLTTGAVTFQGPSAGTVIVTSFPNGWFRVVLEQVATGTGGGPYQIGISTDGTTENYAGTPGSGIFIWGADLRNKIYFPGYQRTERKFYEIASVDSNTQITLTTPFREGTGTNDYTALKSFTGQPPDYWRSATFFKAFPENADVWFATNGIDDIVEWDGVATQVTLSTLPFTCKELSVYKNMLIYGHIIEDTGEVKPTSIKNSDVGVPRDVVGGLAGEFIVQDQVDPMVGLRPLGDNLMIYGQRSIVTAQFVGDPFGFIFRTAFSGLGPISGRAVADFGDFHQFVGPDSLYNFDGASLQKTGLHVWREALRTKSPNRLELTFSHFDEENGDLLWFLPLTSDIEAVGEPNATRSANFALVEHYLENTSADQRGEKPWSRRLAGFLSAGFGERQTNLTWAQLTETWQELDFRWNDQFFESAFPLSLVGAWNGKVFALSTGSLAENQPMTHFIRFSRVPISDGRVRTLLRRVYPYTTNDFAGSIDVIVRLADRAEGDVVITQTLPFDLLTQRFVSVFRRGRFMELEFRKVGQAWEQAGYDYDLTAGGER